MKIDFFQLRPKKHPFPIVAWIIMIFQSMNPFKRSAYSHMAIGYESETGLCKIVDISFSGFRQVREDKFFDGYEIVGTKSMNIDITRSCFLSWLEEHEGKKYDFLQIAGLMLKLLGLKKVNNAGLNFKSLICSELILSLLVRFDKLKVKDSDNWDLNMTWEEI